MTATLGMFVKRPMPGTVKTRLATVIGDAAAARLYRAFVSDLADRFRTFDGRRVLAMTPDDAATRTEFEQLSAGDFELWTQPTGSLGDRLLAYFQTFGRGPAVVIGSDSPTLPKSLVTEAVERLKRSDVVFGPATDGGVYLIGIRSADEISGQFELQKLFDGVEWSTSRVCDQLQRRVELMNASIELLTPWFDVDEPDDLERLKDVLLSIAGPQPVDSPATRAVLVTLTGAGR